jgi:hypothetical protein
VSALGAGADEKIGAPEPAERPRNTLWLTSITAMNVASLLDARSSWGRVEVNPLLRGSDGRFGAQGLAVKSAVVGGVCLFQWLVLRRHPGAGKPFAAVNAAMTGAFAAAAVHNSR